MSNFVEKFLTAIIIIIIAFLVSLLVAWPFMLLWNWLMPMIFGLRVLTFWESLGLLLLCELMFKGSSSSNSNK